VHGLVRIFSAPNGAGRSPTTIKLLHLMRMIFPTRRGKRRGFWGKSIDEVLEARTTLIGYLAGKQGLLFTEIPYRGRGARTLLRHGFNGLTGEDRYRFKGGRVQGHVEKVGGLGTTAKKKEKERKRGNSIAQGIRSGKGPLVAGRRAGDGAGGPRRFCTDPGSW